MRIGKTFSISKGRRGGVVINFYVFGRHILIGGRNETYFSVRNAVCGHWYFNDHLYIGNKDRQTS